MVGTIVLVLCARDNLRRVFRSEYLTTEGMKHIIVLSRILSYTLPLLGHHMRAHAHDVYYEDIRRDACMRA